MTKLIVVCGATGGLGGSVARRMLSEGWRVRGITRNKDSAGAKALLEAGAELASANYDDIASLEAAFEGANAIFGVTNFWEYMLELGAMAAAKKETQQLVNIAIAANKIPSLEHLVMHTLPSGEKLGGKYVPHMDVSCLPLTILFRRILTIATEQRPSRRRHQSAIPRPRQEDHLPVGRLLHKQHLVLSHDETHRDCEFYHQRKKKKTFQKTFHYHCPPQSSN
jgi:hypothetical protein